jgi:hypothetical protein
MRFELRDRRSLEDIYFNATLFAEGVALPVTTRMHIEVHCDSDVDRVDDKDHSFTIEDMELRLLVFFAEIAQAYYERIALPCPTAWITGRGEIVRAVYHAGTDAAHIIVNKYVHLGNTELRSLTKDKIDLLPGVLKTDRTFPDWSHQDASLDYRLQVLMYSYYLCSREW